MAFSPEAIRQLDDLGFTSDKERELYRTIWDSEGEAVFWRFLKTEQESRDLCNHWGPRLREYAIQCRTIAPLPTVQSLSTIDHVKFQILCDKIASRKDEIRPHRKNYVVVLHSSPVGLLAVLNVLGPPSNSVVHLLDAESSHWFNDVYSPDGEPLWWYSFFWWSIKNIDDMDEHDRDYVAKNYPRPDGFTYWVVSDGCQRGPLAGCGSHELWKWDGVNAEAIEVYAVDTS